MTRLLLIALFLIHSQAFAETYWVGKSGSDANACATADGPTDPGAANRKLTIASGIGCLSSGDTLIIGDGVYAEQINNTIPSGTQGAPTTIRAENQQQAILRPTAIAGGPGIVYIVNKDYVTIDGLDIDAVNVSSDAIPVGLGDQPSQNDFITVIRSRLRNAGGGGQFDHGVAGDITNSQILNNTLDNNGCDPGGFGHSIYISGSGNLIEGNQVNGCGTFFAAGIDIRLGPDARNIVRNNVITNTWYCMIAISSSNGVDFYNNLCHGSYGGILISAASNVNFFNNTVDSTGAMDIGEAVLLNGGSSNNAITNNIFYGTVSAVVGEATGAGNTCTTNLNGGGNGVTSDCGDAIGTTDPLFADSGADDFRLASTSSPAYNVGTTLGLVTTDIAGVPRPYPPATMYAIGAYEFVDEVVPGTPPVESFVYVTGSQVHGQNGGEGWTGSWACTDPAGIFVQVAPSGMPTAGNAARSQITTGVICSRTFTALSFATEQTIPIYMQVDNCSPSSTNSSIGIALNSDFTNTGMFVRVQAGNWELWDGGTDGWVTAGACTANLLTRIDFQADESVEANKYRVAINGVYSAYYEVTDSNLTTLNSFMIRDNNTASHTTWWGDIGIDQCAAAVLVFTVQPLLNVLQGQGLGTPTVSIMCAGGEVLVPTATNEVTLATSGGSCTSMTLDGDKVNNAVDGIASFPGLTLTGANGSCTITATASGLTSAVSATITVSATPMFGPAGRLTMRGGR